MYGTAPIKQEPVEDYNGNAPQAGGLLTKIKEEPGLSTPVEASQPRIKQESDPGFGQSGAGGSTARYAICNLPSIDFTSVEDLWRFGARPDPWIRISD